MCFHANLDVCRSVQFQHLIVVLLKMFSILIVTIMFINVQALPERFTLDDAVQDSRYLRKRSSIEISQENLTPDDLQTLEDKDDNLVITARPGPSVAGFLEFISERFGFGSSSQVADTNERETVSSDADLSTSASESSAETEYTWYDDPVVRTLAGMTIGGIIWQILFPPYNTLTIGRKRRSALE